MKLTNYVQHVRKIHDLDELLKECLKIEADLKILEEAASYLTQFYLEARYPADAPEFSLSHAKQARQFALQIRDVILEKIK